MNSLITKPKNRIFSYKKVIVLIVHLNDTNFNSIDIPIKNKLIDVLNCC